MKFDLGMLIFTVVSGEDSLRTQKTQYALLLV